MKALEWSQHFSHFKSTGIFPEAQRQLASKSVIGDYRMLNPFMVVLVTCKNKEEPIKNEGV